MQCTNQLKQMGVALHNYHDVHNGFPALYSRLVTEGTEDARHFFGTVVKLMPFMEMNARYDGLVAHFKANAGHTPTWTDTPAEYREGPISILNCPSDGTAKMPAAECNFARNSYVFCLGDVAYQNGGRNHANGVRAMFSPGQWKSFSTMTDGSSNTIGVSETVTCSNRHDLNVKSGYAHAPGMISDTSKFDPSKCVDLRSKTDRSVLNATSTANTWRGSRYLVGHPANSGFCTILPPNSPNCLDSSAGNDNATNGAYSPSSNHSGGVNALYMDGSVAFITDTIDCGDLTIVRDQATVRGQSVFGVWGALGTPAGSESKRP